MCFYSGSNRMVAVGVDCRYLWALYISCSRAVVSWQTLCLGKARDTPVQSKVVCGNMENEASLRLWEVFS